MQPPDAADALEDPMEIDGLADQQTVQSPMVLVSLFALLWFDSTWVDVDVPDSLLRVMQDKSAAREANGASPKARRGRRPVVVSDDEDG